MYVRVHGYAPIQFYLQEEVVGQIWPTGPSLLWGQTNLGLETQLSCMSSSVICRFPCLQIESGHYFFSVFVTRLGGDIHMGQWSPSPGHAKHSEKWLLSLLCPWVLKSLENYFFQLHSHQPVISVVHRFSLSALWLWTSGLPAYSCPRFFRMHHPLQVHTMALPLWGCFSSSPPLTAINQFSSSLSGLSHSGFLLPQAILCTCTNIMFFKHTLAHSCIEKALD